MELHKSASPPSPSLPAPFTSRPIFRSIEAASPPRPRKSWGHTCMTSALGMGAPKSKQKEQTQRISVRDKGERGSKKSKRMCGRHISIASYLLCAVEGGRATRRGIKWGSAPLPLHNFLRTTSIHPSNRSMDPGGKKRTNAATPPPLR